MKTGSTVVFLSTLIAVSLFFTLGCGLVGNLFEAVLEGPITELGEEVAESTPQVRPGATTAWPSWMPVAVPEYRYGDVFQVLEAEDGGSLVFINVQLDPDPYEAYKQDLLANGWVVEEESDTDVAKHLHVYRDGHSLRYAFPKDGQGVALYYFAASGTPTDESAPATTATLDDLSSYRLEITVTVRQSGEETRNSYLFEWTKKPFVYRRMTDMGEVVIDYLWAEGRAWMRTGDGAWSEIQDDAAPDPLEDVLMDSSTEGMTFDGEETINGIRCRCYVDETTMLDMIGQNRLCVAAQTGIPPLVIFHSMQIEQEGIFQLTERNLYDINQPFTIETPE